MNASPLPAAPANENARVLRLELLVTDPEVAHELAQHAPGNERDAYAKHALRLGVLALRQASGALDVETIQREADRMLHSVSELMAGRTAEVSSALAQTLAQHVGTESAIFKMLSPEQSGGVVAAFARTIDQALKAQAEEMLRQFSLDRPDSALSRLLSGVTTANGSVLDALATSNAAFQADVRATLEGFKARRQEQARSPEHGHTFEAAVGDFLQREAQRVGDVCEAVGTTTGSVDRKTGDHVLTLGPDSGAPDARIACEAKARKGYTEKSALDEIARARKNRDAEVGLVIMDRASAPEGLEALRRVGSDVLVLWDPDDVASDHHLRLAVSVARALCVRAHVASSQSEANLEQLDSSIESIANQIRVIDEIVRAAHTIRRRGDKITASAEKLRETLEREVITLQDNVRALREEEAS
jgi:hypothetical protein